MNTKIVISDVVGTSWKNVKSQIWILAGLFIGMEVVVYIISLLLSALSTSVVGNAVVALVGLIVSSIFALGYIRNMFQTMDGDEPRFSAYKSSPAKIFTYAVASVLLGLLVCVGLVFFIIPGVYLYLRLQFFGQFIVDEDADIIGSLQKSWNLTKGHAMPLFLLSLVQLLILIVGAVLFLIGLVVAYPLCIMIQCHVYRLLGGKALAGQNDWKKADAL